MGWLSIAGFRRRFLLEEKLSRLSGTIKEITTSISQVKAYVQGIVDRLPCGIIIANHEGRLLLFNSVARQLFGSRLEACLGGFLRDTVESGHPESALAMVADLILEALLNQAGENEVEIPYIPCEGDDEGRTGSLVVSTSLIYGAHEEVIGVIATVQDVSEQKRLRELLFAAERLATLGEIAASAAHELKNPLTAIKGMAQIIELDLVDETARKRYIKAMITEIDRLNQMVSEVLAWARPLPSEPSFNNIHDVLEEVAFLIGARARIQKVKIQRDFRAERPHVFLEAKLFKQAVLNLAINAIQAMPDGGELLLKSYNPDSANFLKVEISDTGVGIPENVKHRVFEPFFTTKETGTGLGLVVANEIIKSHGGTLSFISKEKEGTTFTITLPCSPLPTSRASLKFPSQL